MLCIPRLSLTCKRFGFTFLRSPAGRCLCGALPIAGARAPSPPPPPIPPSLPLPPACHSAPISPIPTSPPPCHSRAHTQRVWQAGFRRLPTPAARRLAGSPPLPAGSPARRLPFCLLWHGLLTFGAAVPEITARAQLGQVSGLESRSRRPNRGQKRGGERALSSSAGDSSQPEGGEGWGKEAFRPPLYEAFAETRISTFTALLPVQRALLRNGVLKNQQNTKKDFARS